MRLMIIGKLEGHITAAGRMAMDRGAKVIHAHSVAEGLAALRAGRGGDMVMIDVAFDVKSFMEHLTAEHINVPVVACGIGGTSDRAVSAIQAGAKEYIPLPPDPELIAAVIEAVSRDESEMLYKDPAMRNVVKMARQIAPSEASVLLTGESGTGKEVMARFLHQNSLRKEKPFIPVNCAAIPEHLLESELFGHEKGAFTGAIARRIGKFEEANNGTLLLDEISEMDMRLQAKLLRAIQEREIDRVGGSQPVHVNIRLIATTNRDLLKEVDAGRFREDLYYRLNVVSLKLPPLRERLQDIDILSQHFLKKFSAMNHVKARPFSREAMEAIKQNPWRGNIRELENAIHRAVLLADGHQIERHIVISGQETPGKEKPATTSLVGQTVSTVERGLIINTLDHCLGNRTHAANILGISIRTLRNKLKQYATEGDDDYGSDALHESQLSTG